MIKKTWTGYAALLTAAIVAGEVANLMHGGDETRGLEFPGLHPL